MASDGKWYAPHLHSDASYRARWVNADIAVAQPSAAPDVLQTPPEPATTISEPVAESSWVPEQQQAATNGQRPVADVPPHTAVPQQAAVPAPAAAPFVASEQVAERAAALSETSTASRPDTIAQPVAPPIAPAKPVAPLVAEPPVVAEPPPVDSVMAAPVVAEALVEAPVVSEPTTMPEPIVAPLDAPAPIPTSEPVAPLGFGAPSSTPVSEILSRLGSEPMLGRNGAVNGPAAAPTTSPTPSFRTPAAPQTAPAPAPTPAPEPISDPTPEPVIEFEHPAEPAQPEPTVEPPTAPLADVADLTVVAPDIVDEAPTVAEVSAPVDPVVDPVRVGPAEVAESVVAEAPSVSAPEQSDEAVTPSRARLEVGSPDRGEERFGLLTPTRPTEQRIQLQEAPVMSTSTDLVPVPQTEIAVYDDGASIHDRLVAAVLFLSGVAMIVGTFLVWTVSPVGDVTGWDMSDGIGTIVAGVIGSAAAGPIFVGFRHIIPKSLAIVAGLAGLVIVGLRGLEVLSDSAVAETTVGFGFWLVLGASITMLLGAVADQSRFGD